LPSAALALYNRVMADFSSWVQNNWSSAVGSAGIIGSLWMGIAAAHREAKAREIQNVLRLSEHHHELWNSLNRRPGLDRIRRTDAEVLVDPLTTAEQEFINLAIVHYLTGWRIAEAGGITTLTELAADVRGFFCLPLPHAVWEKTKQYRNQRFVRFVDRALTSR
jgi:hypothetical protein